MKKLLLIIYLCVSWICLFCLYIGIRFLVYPGHGLKKLFYTVFYCYIYLIFKYFIVDMYLYVGSISIWASINYVFLTIVASGYISLLERQIVALVQQRVGPSLIGGLGGVFQPIADGFKLIIKELTVPAESRFFVFIVAPILSLGYTFLLWTSIPASSNVVHSFMLNKEYTLLLILVLFLLANYGSVFGGWASSNKFALLGAYRAVALSAAYGITIGLILLLPVLLSQSLNIYEIVFAQRRGWFFFPMFDGVILFWAVLLTEIKKVPFDVSESEAELGSGYLIEYGGLIFALFIIAEYAGIMFLCNLFAIMFLGGWLPPRLPHLFDWVYRWSIWDSEVVRSIGEDFVLSTKTLLALVFYLTLRSILPNFRFDYVMRMHWKYLFPILILITVINYYYL